MRKPVLVALFAASLVICACGGSSKTSSPPAEPAQAPAAAASAPAAQPSPEPAADPAEAKPEAAATTPAAPATSAVKEPRSGASSGTPPVDPKTAAVRPVPRKPAVAAAPPPEHPTFSQTDLKKGTGATAEQGKRLTVNYTGWLYDPAEPEQKGRQFDSSVGGQPFEFVLGARKVIRGWDQGFDGMKVGGKRRLVIPPELGYGERGFGNGVIPPSAALVFEMELMDVADQ